MNDTVITSLASTITNVGCLYDLKTLQSVYILKNAQSGVNYTSRSTIAHDWGQIYDNMASQCNTWMHGTKGDKENARN